MTKLSISSKPPEFGFSTSRIEGQELPDLSDDAGVQTPPDTLPAHSDEAVPARSLYRSILDAIPHMVLIVDRDVRVVDCNATAEEILGTERKIFLRQRGGEVLSCIHATDVPEGCGHGPYCSSCVIRNSVTECLNGQIVRRRRTRAQLAAHGTVKDFELLVTASPFAYRGRELALLILEDISEISTLRSLIPICAKCKKIRGDDQYWKNVEQYFSEHLGVDFSHGLCPECYGDTLGDWLKKRA